MWKLNCGCNTPVEENIEIISPKKNSYKVHLQNTTNRIDLLKHEIISDFYDIIQALECGILPDLQEILEEISIIEINKIYNISKEIFIN